MAYTLTGTRYIGTGSLPTPVAGYDAVDTSTGNLYASNTSATSWVLIGNVNSPNMGLAPVAGYTSTGAIQGAHGLSPVDSPNFTTSAKLESVNLATVNDLAATEASILDSISPKITEAVAATTSSIGVASNIAIGVGNLTFTTSANQTIPLPTYPDGTTADEADCKWMAFFVGNNLAGTFTKGWTCGSDNGTDDDTSLVWSANPATTRSFNARTRSKDGEYMTTIIGYMIIGVRS